MANLQEHARKKWRAEGYYIEAGEHVFRGGGRVTRRDTFGFADLICVKPGSLVFLQVTSWSNVSARVNKIACERHGKGQWSMPMAEIAKNLMSCCGVRIVVEGWRKNPKTFRWESREVEITPLLLDGRKRRRCP
jgi:hypothetical protein